jgi:hypothetical protein
MMIINTLDTVITIGNKPIEPNKDVRFLIYKNKNKVLTEEFKYYIVENKFVSKINNDYKFNDNDTVVIDKEIYDIFVKDINLTRKVVFKGACVNLFYMENGDVCC